MIWHWVEFPKKNKIFTPDAISVELHTLTASIVLFAAKVSQNEMQTFWFVKVMFFSETEILNTP